MPRSIPKGSLAIRRALSVATPTVALANELLPLDGVESASFDSIPVVFATLVHWLIALNASGVKKW